LNAENGLSEIWKTQATNAGIRPSPLVTDDFVVVAARNGQVVWLTRETGAVEFSEDVGSEILSDIVLIEPGETLEIEPRVVVSTVSTSRLLVAFNLSDGVQLWTYSR
jgi:outer membrane protein assembly factor BamB